MIVTDKAGVAWSIPWEPPVTPGYFDTRTFTDLAGMFRAMVNAAPLAPIQGGLW